MEDDNELPADEILGKYGDTMNFHLDNIIDPPNDDGEMNLIKPSPYFGIDCLPHSLVHTRGQLNILSINAQSLNSKYDELLLLLNIAQSQNIRFHVICVQETWLSEMSDYSLVAIDGYNCIHQSKRAECSNHGGLITYVDNKYEVDRLDITRRSENDDTPQPLDQWTNSPFIGQQVGNWSICHALWPIRKPIVHPTLYPTHISFIPSQSNFPFLKYGY